MPSLPEAIVTFLSVFAPLFSSPVWNHVQVLLIGAILCQGPRTVTGRLRVMGLGEEKSFCNYPGVPLVIVVDETIERRKGRKIKAIREISGCGTFNEG